MAEAGKSTRRSIEADDYVVINAPMQVVRVVSYKGGEVATVAVRLPVMKMNLEVGDKLIRGISSNLTLEFPVHLVDKIKLPKQTVDSLPIQKGPYR